MCFVLALQDRTGFVAAAWLPTATASPPAVWAGNSLQQSTIGGEAVAAAWLTAATASTPAVCKGNSLKK